MDIVQLRLISRKFQSFFFFLLLLLLLPDLSVTDVLEKEERGREGEKNSKE